MPANITAKVELGWEWEDGDGSPCFNCGDTAWLKQLRLIMIFNRRRMDGRTPVLCGSCGEQIKPDESRQ